MKVITPTFVFALVAPTCIWNTEINHYDIKEEIKKINTDYDLYAFQTENIDN